MVKKVRTGDIHELTSCGRLGLVESVVTIDSIQFAVIYPLSYAVYMATDKDFIILDDVAFGGKPIMAEEWNKISLPLTALRKKVSALDEKHMKYFSSFVYFRYQSSKNPVLRVLTGPPLVNNTDIRHVFQAQELEELSPIRTQLVSSKKDT